MRFSTTLLILTVASAASADDKMSKVVKAAPPAAVSPAATAEIVARLEAIASKTSGATSNLPAFAFTGNLTLDPPSSFDVARMGFADTALVDPKRMQISMPSPDTAWISAALSEFSECGKAGCAKTAPDQTVRAVALFEKVGDAWQPLAWSITPSILGKAQQDAMDEGVVPDAIASRTEGADDVVKLFTSSLADPKAFAATFADRKEVLLQGSENTERYAGPQAKATITKWGFGFTVRDGTRAGMSKSGTVAWVAANVDAKSVKKPKAKSIPFRAFALYEKIGDQWKLVQIQFSTSV